MTAFHTSKTLYNTGDMIAASIDFFSKLKKKPAHLEVERVFQDRAPAGKPKRSESRYVFRDLDSAQNWAEERLERRLYQVELPAEALEHQADWRWLEHGLKALRRGDMDALHDAADSYWRGDFTDEPCIEWLVSEAVVVRELPTVSEDEKRARKAAKLGMPSLEEIARQFHDEDGSWSSQD
ncbi:MAG: hypothetical protein P3A58_06325 [Gemmatimonadota bacterium]|nr:hypothetical protein [Gemmatimonadota bacterium]